jgi:Plasmid pRiA4b ORF-3-like protein
MVKQLALSGDLQVAVATAHEPASAGKHHRRALNALTFRLEYFPDQIGALPDGDFPPTPLKNWDRVFVISDRLTLEQFASVIIDLLAWDEDHLYEFHIADTVYVHMGDPCSDFFVVDAVNPCVSCAIRLHYLNLSPSTTFAFVFDFGRCHLLRLTTLEASPHRGDNPLPFLVSHRGKNLHQYSGEMSGVSDAASRRTPRQSIEFGHVAIRRPSSDSCAQRTTQRSSSGARPMTRDYGRRLSRSWRTATSRWRRSLRRLNVPSTSFNDGSWHSITVGCSDWIRPPKNRSPGKREAAVDIRKKRLLDILHDRPRSFGINRPVGIAPHWRRLTQARTASKCLKPA